MAKCHAGSASDALQSEQLPVVPYRTAGDLVAEKHPTPPGNHVIEIRDGTGFSVLSSGATPRSSLHDGTGFSALSSGATSGSFLHDGTGFSALSSGDTPGSSLQDGTGFSALSSGATSGSFLHEGTGLSALSSGATPGSFLHFLHYPKIWRHTRIVFCRPCGFHKRPAGCKNGNACQFCHSDDHRQQHKEAMRLRQAKKPQKHERKAMRDRSASEAITSSRNKIPVGGIWL
eukprot:TRINITY_DN9947_c0_g1_i7.p2 TRINITY_DN9947_c0_g1~~TRINITY_DN9947_c0_g1_i7.p2  ORF type:complete len:231 (-),score=12.87 TRINITY_DN9947_c0_g1_i7:65-757(-)